MLASVLCQPNLVALVTLVGIGIDLDDPKLEPALTAGGGALAIAEFQMSVILLSHGVLLRCLRLWEMKCALCADYLRTLRNGSIVYLTWIHSMRVWHVVEIESLQRSKYQGV